MMRRSFRLFLFPILLLVFGAFGHLSASAAEGPVVLDVYDSAFSAADRATILDEANAIEQILREGYPIPSYRLSSRGWLDVDFVVFTAGRIEEGGYEVAVVEGEDAAGTNRFWILVAVPLEGRTAWIPVEAAPSELGHSYLLGRIPWSGDPGSPFEPAYARFHRVVELSANASPTVSFVAVGRAVMDERTTFHATARDPDGAIIAYLWFIDGEQVSVETTAIYKFTFGGTGEREVTLVVVDNRGAEASATRIVDVQEEAGCGCH